MFSVKLHMFSPAGACDELERDEDIDLINKNPR